MSQAVASIWRWGSIVWDEYRRILSHPEHAIDLARKGIDLTAEAARLALMSNDPPTSLKGRLGARKRAAWSERIALSEVKTIGQLFGSSVNDVLLACVTGALRAHLRSLGEAIEGLEIRALVPVNLRSPDERDPLGNHFGLVFLPLPVGMDCPLERLATVRARMQALKGSAQAVLAWGVLNAMGMAPELLEREIVGTLSAKASLVMTNVPGPREVISLAGVPIGELIFWVPQAGDIGVGVSVVSYAGFIQIGLLADRQRIADPEAVVERFQREVAGYVTLGLMAGSDGTSDASGLITRTGRSALAQEGASEPTKKKRRRAAKRPR